VGIDRDTQTPAKDLCEPLFVRMDAPASELRQASETMRRLLAGRIRRFKRRGVIRAFGQWTVTTYGLENLTGPDSYEIDKAALHHPWWSESMAEKCWVNRADFDAAVSFAREHFGITAEVDSGARESTRPAGQRSRIEP
jgi:hypothetical protein